jgi:hypothetical protein
MGLFGEIDAADIPENPFYVAPDTYKCVLAEAGIVDKKDNSGQGLSFKWVIEEEESDYNGQNISDWKNIYPDLTADEKTAKITQDLSRLRQRLTEMGLTTEEMNDLDAAALDELIGMQAWITVKESTDKNDPDKVYSNITKVSLDDPDEE